MRPVRRSFPVVLALLLAAGVIAYLGLDGLLKRTVESQSTASLRLRTTVNSARLSLFGGKVTLNELRIASPQGFSAPHMLELGNVDMAVRYGQLREDPIHVQSLTLNRPLLVIEQAGGALNFKKAAEGMPASEGSSKKPVRLIIDELKMQEGQVVIHPGLPGVRQEIVVPVPSIALKSVGGGRGAQNGAAIKDVALEVISALARAAAESGSLPLEVKSVLQLNAGLQSLAKDPAGALQGRIGEMPGGKTKDAPAAPQPPAAGRSGAPTKR